jgi:hypothetical protein
MIVLKELDFVRRISKLGTTSSVSRLYTSPWSSYTDLRLHKFYSGNQSIFRPMDPTEGGLHLVLFLKTQIQSTPKLYGFHKRWWWTKYKIKFTVKILKLSLCRHLEDVCEWVKNIHIFNNCTREVWGFGFTSWPLYPFHPLLRTHKIRGCCVSVPLWKLAD